MLADDPFGAADQPDDPHDPHGPSSGPHDPSEDWLTWLLDSVPQAPQAPADDPSDPAAPDPSDPPYEVQSEITLEKTVASVSFRLRGFWDNAPLEAPTWLIEGVLPAKGVTMIHAPAGVGKTWVVDDWAVRIASGTPWLGRPVMAGGVVYIAAEGAFTLPLRTYAAKANLGIHRELPLFTISEPILFGADGTHPEILAEMVKSAFQRRGLPSVALVVVDTYTACLEGSANDDNVASAFTRKFRQFLRKVAAGGGAVPAGLIVHHPGLQDAERGRGSSALFNDVDCGYLLEALQPVGGGEVDSQPQAQAPAEPAATGRVLVLHNAKAPRQGTPPPDIALSLEPTILTDDEAQPLEVAGEPLTALVVRPMPGETCRKSKQTEQIAKRRMQESRAVSCLRGSEPLQSEAWRRKSEVSSTSSWERIRDGLVAEGKVKQVEPLPGKTRWRYALSSADHPGNQVDEIPNTNPSIRGGVYTPPDGMDVGGERKER